MIGLFLQSGQCPKILQMMEKAKNPYFKHLRFIDLRISQHFQNCFVRFCWTDHIGAEGSGRMWCQAKGPQRLKTEILGFFHYMLVILGRKSIIMPQHINLGPGLWLNLEGNHKFRWQSKLNSNLPSCQALSNEPSYAPFEPQKLNRSWILDRWPRSPKIWTLQNQASKSNRLCSLNCFNLLNLNRKLYSENTLFKKDVWLIFIYAFGFLLNRFTKKK